jgi:cytochrome c oxidase subunit 2
VDVIHSPFVPQFRYKQDAVPGREIGSWFEVTKPGKYEMPCAELCGFGHSGMRGWVYAHTAEDYAKWAAENLRAEAPAATAAKDEPKPGPTPVARTQGKGKQ